MLNFLFRILFRSEMFAPQPDIELRVYSLLFTSSANVYEK